MTPPCHGGGRFEAGSAGAGRAHIRAHSDELVVDALQAATR
jgi:hypothetical protein